MDGVALSVQGEGCKVQCVGYRVWDVGLRVKGSEFGVCYLGFRV